MRAVCLALTLVAATAGAAPPLPHKTAPPKERGEAPAPKKDGPGGAIRNLLDTQAAAWNQGDLEGYMAGYWKSPELVFYAGGAVTRGWEETFARYKARYTGEGREMGQLSFFDLTVELVTPKAAFARGRWKLKTKDREDAGLFTLFLKKVPEGWRIVHDHSSM
jgi:beta-aspartyl-peptidase (threonine type)